MEKTKEARHSTERDKTKGKIMVYGAALLYTLVVGFSFLAVKIAMKSASPLEVLTHRFNFAAIGAMVPLALGFVRIDINEKPFLKLFLSSGCYLFFMVLQAIGLLFATSIESGIFFAIIPCLL
ncbi:MAG: EamA family transporter [Peptococcales bacterium]|jgi:hypothetical protein